jgi:hypothetical protein
MAIISSSCYADTIVVPQSFTSVEGPSNNTWPFYRTNLGSPDTVLPMRYQQVYAAAEFAPLSSPIQITQIAFRPQTANGVGPFSQSLPGVQIDLSTTTRIADGLNQTFAANTGADDITVFPMGPLTISSAYTGPAVGPKDFDIVINLNSPFIYNPANGNLLLDIRVSGGGTAGIPFDATAITNSDGLSRRWAADAEETQGLLSDSQGLITQFGFTTVPEPSAFSLIAIGTALVAFARRKIARACDG